ncbi:MAG TPA: C25 family cysteine peptidase [Candidatus Eisenbacteria bacterium]|jgi:hypothetical protein
MKRRSLPPALPFALPILLAAWLAPAAEAGPIQLVAQDDRGVTLRLTVPSYDLGAPGEDGRQEILIQDLDLLDVPGRPKLPYATTLVAIPPGAKAVAAVIESGAEEARDGLHLTIGERPMIRPDRAGLDWVATREPVGPIADGAWPRSPVDVGEPFSLRRQRVVLVTLQPFRYDVAAGRLWTRTSVTVRVSFVAAGAAPLAAAGAPAPADRGWEPVLRSTVLNYEQGRRFRASRPALSPRGLFDRPGPWRAGPAGVLGAPPFDESEPEVRVRIETTGAWALDAAELLDKGYPAGVPVGEVSVHRHEFLEGVRAPNPPYFTPEVPIEVEDADNDGFLSTGDRIVLYAQSWWERSGLAYVGRVEYAQRLWGEADYVYATRVRRPGQRILPRGGWNGLTLTPLASYPYTQRWEHNISYNGAPGDTITDAFLWIQRPLYYNRADSIHFEIYDLDATRDASFGLEWTGLLSTTENFVWAAIKNDVGQITMVVDSARSVGKVSFSGRSTIPGTALSEGSNNRFLMWGKDHDAPPDPSANRFPDVGLDFFEATYWRAYHALQGYLPCNSAAATGDYEIYATGFTDSSALRVYDVTDSSAIRRLSGVRIERAGGGYALRFQDNTSGPRRRYLAFDRPKAPLTSDYGRVDRPAITTLYERDKGDYLLVVPEEFADAVGPLAALRASQGYDVVLARLDALNDAFNGGRKSAYAIKRFIRYAYDNWDARFVLLAGDGSEDPQQFSAASGVDYVPTQRILGPVVAAGDIESFSEAIVSDSWYVWCVECADPGTWPFIPDLQIGRLPVKSVEETNAVVSKLVSYENVTPDQTWRRKMVLVADDMYSGQTFFGGSAVSTDYCRRTGEVVFRLISEKCRSIVLNDAGLGQSDPEVFNISYYVPNYPSDLVGCTQRDTCRCDATAIVNRSRAFAKPALFQRLAEGRLWWNFQGHANERVLSHEAFYSNGYQGMGDDKDQLANDGKPFLFTAFSCHPNAFGRYQENSNTRQGPPLGEDLVLLPNRGAIASWASSGFELLPSSGTRHINVAFARALFDTLPIDSTAFDPTRGARPLLGEVISKAEVEYLRPYNRPTGSPDEWNVMISYNLLGDPATRISLGAVQSILFANQTPVTNGVPVRLFTIGDTLRLEGDLVSNARIDSIWIERIEGGGTVVVPRGDYTLSPPFPDVTYASSGGAHYHVVYRTTLARGSYTYRFRTLDRYGVAGQFDAVFRFETTLRAEGGVVRDGDVLSPSANLSILLLSPSPLVPANDLALTLNGTPVLFRADPANNDQSGREWILSWTHDPYPEGGYRLELSVRGSLSATHTFRVTSRLQLQNALAFPNPFNDTGGTVFSFYLESDRLAKVLLRVYAISGRMIYERTLSAVPAGYQQIPWDGKDAEGRELGNGVYFYRLEVENGVASSRFLGRLVKLKKPRHVTEDLAP